MSTAVCQNTVQRSGVFATFRRRVETGGGNGAFCGTASFGRFSRCNGNIAQQRCVQLLCVTAQICCCVAPKHKHAGQRVVHADVQSRCVSASAESRLFHGRKRHCHAQFQHNKAFDDDASHCNFRIEIQQSDRAVVAVCYCAGQSKCVLWRC